MTFYSDSGATIWHRDPDPEVEIERLRSALEALLADIDDFGEPRRHERAMSVAREVLSSGVSGDQP